MKKSKKPQKSTPSPEVDEACRNPEPDNDGTTDTPEVQAATDLFEQGLIARGEAVPPSADGTIPAHATHKLIPKKPGDPPEPKRDKFRAY